MNQITPPNQFPIAGKTITYEEFFSPNACKIQKIVDYYEGDQQNYVIAILNGAMNGWGKRKEWQHRGIIPRVRNVTKAIVEKSGMLFNKPPALNIVLPGQTNNEPVVDPVLNEILENADWVESMQNIDIYTRLCGSIVVLEQLILPDNRTTTGGVYQYDYTQGDQLVFTILHHGNTVVRMNESRTQITELAYIMGDNSYILNADGVSSRPKQWKYCVWTPEEILVIQVDEDKELTNQDGMNQIETEISREPNTNGIVPASFIYDTRKPRKGHWCRPPEDLISLQEMVNLSLTDTEFAVAFQKQKTLFITGDLENDDNNSGDQLIPAAQMGHTAGGTIYNDIPFYQTRKQTFLGGLGSVAKLGVDGAGTAGKAEFVGPDTDLGKLDDIINHLIESVANDWSVNLNYGGGGKANSGFQLVVEEIDNLNLRQQRAYMMQAGMRRMYEILKVLFPGQLTDGYLQVEFAEPNLPVNREENENLWTIKIDNGRASVIDYFMDECGMTQEEAIMKATKIQQENELYGQVVPPPPAPPAPGGNEAVTSGVTNG